jgi:N-acetylglucosaminyldiphosphoundecaprenol N-acetyl-beta-D-mannosaminyltransferase
MNRLSRSGTKVLDVFIDALTWDSVLSRISDWAANRESRYICICNVHSVITANLNDNFRRIVNGADMATPDGMPLAWVLRRLGFSRQQRINGPDLMWRYCALAESQGKIIYLYGSTDETLAKLTIALAKAFPALRIGGRYAPPFRPTIAVEDATIVKSINDSGAGVVFVALGCPKQEEWMAIHRNHIKAVTIGVGAAFDYHAGTLKRAPNWMQHNGLEWLYRVLTEPRRLWRRYLVTNTLFLIGISRQFFKRLLKRSDP